MNDQTVNWCRYNSKLCRKCNNTKGTPLRIMNSDFRTEVVVKLVKCCGKLYFAFNVGLTHVTRQLGVGLTHVTRQS